MQFNFQESDRAWDGEFVIIPEGLYEVTVTNAEDEADKNNNQRMRVTLRVDKWIDAPNADANKDHVGKELPHFLSGDNDTKRKRAMHFLSQVGMDAGAGKSVNVSKSDMIGKRLRVRCTYFYPRQPDGSQGKPMVNFSEELRIGEAEIRVR